MLITSITYPNIIIRKLKHGGIPEWENRKINEIHGGN